MGFSVSSSTAPPPSHNQNHRTDKIFLFCNYALIGAASSCIFLTLSLRLLPSVSGLSLILLHALTISAAVCGCSVVSSGGKYYSTHMVATVMAAILQGAAAVLVFTRTADFLGYLRSYVRENDGAVILKLSGGLSVIIFALEWVVLTLAFFWKYYVYKERSDVVLGRPCKVQPQPQEENLKDWPWPFQV